LSKITIDVKSRTPIFEQLHNNILRLALDGVLAADEQLPSVRALACELAINPNTIQRAYAELERDGIIYSLPARGSFISSDLTAAKNATKNEVCKALAEEIKKAKHFGITREEIEEILKREWR